MSDRAVATDAAGALADAIFQYVVVYDPNGGFVTGGSWISSPDDADPTTTLGGGNIVIHK